MPRYAILASYLPEHWDRLIVRPHMSVQGFRRAVENLGCTLESFDYLLGPHDLLAIIQAPDLVSQTAVSIFLASTNVFEALETRELIAPEVIGAALNAVKAQRAAEEPPVAG